MTTTRTPRTATAIAGGLQLLAAHGGATDIHGLAQGPNDTLSFLTPIINGDSTTDFNGAAAGDPTAIAAFGGSYQNAELTGLVPALTPQQNTALDLGNPSPSTVFSLLTSLPAGILNSASQADLSGVTVPAIGSAVTLPDGTTASTSATVTVPGTVTATAAPASAPAASGFNWTTILTYGFLAGAAYLIWRLFIHKK